MWKMKMKQRGSSCFFDSEETAEGVEKCMQMDVGQLNSSSSDPRDLLKKFQLILQNPVLLKHHHRGDSPESSSCSVNFRPSRVDLDIRIPEDHQDLVSDDSPHRDTRPPEDHLLCPRCESTNTKFCYFNNYNLTQPRYFCKTCRRYWTRGGALRRVPVGGGVRRYSNKRARTTKTPSGVTTKSHQMVTASGSVMS